MWRHKNKVNNANKPDKIWRQGNNPYRSLIFWGWNNENQPSFLILYGVHEFEEKKEYHVEGSHGIRFENVLADDVKYTSYAVFNGMNGHLPSFEAVRIEEGYGYYSRDEQKEYPKMYYKKAFKGYGRNKKCTVKEYKKFAEGSGIEIPYFTEISYSDLVETVINSDVEFENFRFAKSPNEVIALAENLQEYYELLCIMMSDKNLYMRKKKLTELIDPNPAAEIYDIIFSIGSTEVLSGLLLEAAKRNINSFIKNAEYIVNEESPYASDSYMNGLKRCAEIYLNSVIDERRKEREKWIHENLTQIDLPLIKIGDWKVPEGMTFNGERYRELANKGKLREHYSYYEYVDGRWNCIKRRYMNRYQKGTFNNGVVFDIKKFKNTLQEAEAYNMADVIGKIAYYLDAPRLHYYFKGNDLNKELKYYKRYIRRILEGYAKNDSDRFMEAMKVLLTSYTNDDFLCKFYYNFQFNYFIKNILYHEFNEKPPAGGWDYGKWKIRYDWMSNDQLLAQQGRYELMKEVWDSHLEDVLYIASNAHIETVLKACYFIFKESSKTNQLIANMRYEEIIKMAMVSYEPLAEMFMAVLENKLANETAFDFKLMMLLMNNDNEAINELAIDYFKKTNGSVAGSDIADLMILNNWQKWTEYIKVNIERMDSQNYLQFVTALIKECDQFKDGSIEVPEEVIDVLSESVNKIGGMQYKEKAQLLKYAVDGILTKGSMAGVVENYLEEIIFAYSYNEIGAILKEDDLQHQKTMLSSRNNRIINIINAIINNNIPSDSIIVSILEDGTSKVIKTLFEIIDINEKELMTRYSTMLIMLESDVLMLNRKAERLFEVMDEEARVKMHKVIIDSPVKKVYQYGLKKLQEIYGEFVPAEFIMQMLEHTSTEVKSYITDKSESILESLGDGNKDLFMYYAKTLILLPNRVRKNKEDVYDALYKFAVKYEDKRNETEELLLYMGGSNIIKDSEKALVTLAKIRKEAAV